MKRKSTSKILLIISLSLVAIPIFFYLLIFGSHGLSRDQEQWSHFATYITAFASIANLIVVYGIAREAQVLSEQGQEESRIFKEANEKPVIYLSQRIDSTAWFISNIGRGAALNLRIGIEINLPGGKPFGPKVIVKGYALAPERDTLVVNTNRHISRFFIFYEDVRQQTYISVTNNHETIMRKIGSFDSPTEFEPITFDDQTKVTLDELIEISRLRTTNPTAFSRSDEIHIFPERLMPR